MGRGSSKVGGGREVGSLEQSAENVSGILDEYARLTNGRKIDGDAVTLADGTTMTKDEYDDAVRTLTKEYLNEAAKQREIGEKLGIDTTTGQAIQKEGGSSRAASSTEQNIYEMKNATQKQVKSTLENAPKGTTIAMEYSEGGNTTVYEKVTEDVWAETVLHKDGSVSTGFNNGNIVRRVQEITKDKTITKGLSEAKREKYNRVAKPMIERRVNGK